MINVILLLIAYAVIVDLVANGFYSVLTFTLPTVLF